MDIRTSLSAISAFASVASLAVVTSERLNEARRTRQRKELAETAHKFDALTTERYQKLKERFEVELRDEIIALLVPLYAKLNVSHAEMLNTQYAPHVQRDTQLFAGILAYGVMEEEMLQTQKALTEEGARLGVEITFSPSDDVQRREDLRQRGIDLGVVTLLAQWMINTEATL